MEERKQLLAMEEGGEEYKAKEELVNLARQQQQQHKAAATNVYMSDGLGGEKGGGVGSGAAGAAGGGLGRPGVPQATNELLEKKRALERQLRELEEQLGGGGTRAPATMISRNSAATIPTYILAACEGMYYFRKTIKIVVLHSE